MCVNKVGVILNRLGLFSEKKMIYVFIVQWCLWKFSIIATMYRKQIVTLSAVAGDSFCGL